MYRNSRLKHVKKIRETIKEMCSVMNYSEFYFGNVILDQCTLLLEKKKKRLACGCKKNVCVCDPSSWSNNKPDRCVLCPKKDKKKYSLPNEKEILGMLDGLHVCKGDGNVYLSYPPKWKCKTCGKFFTEQLPS